MKVIYVAGKYSASTWSGIEDNIRKAEAAALKLVAAGWAVICPHKNTAHWEVYDFFLWIDMDLEILRRCDAVFMLDGFQQSEGAMREFAEACNQKLEVYYEEDGIPCPDAEGSPDLPEDAYIPMLRVSKASRKVRLTAGDMKRRKPNIILPEGESTTPA